MQNTVEVTTVKPYAGSTTLMAHLDVRIGDLLVHGVKILQNEKSELWTAMPSTEKDGKFYDVVEIDSRSRDRQIKVEIVRQYRQLAGVTDDPFAGASPVPVIEPPEKEGVD